MKQALSHCRIASILAVLAFGWSAGPWAPPVQAADREETLPGRPDVTQRTIVVTPDPAKFSGPLRAAVLLYVGGNGSLKETRGNFLMRIRQRLADAGFLVALPDAPSDRVGGSNMNGSFRASQAQARDAQAVVEFLKKQGDGQPLPVFVIGTSRGSTSAANVAARLGPDLITGAGLTSTVTQNSVKGQISVYETPLKDIRVPTLVMWHQDDACKETPPERAAELTKALTAAPKIETKTLSGGLPPRSASCDALAAHGYYGIEGEATAALLAWMDGLLAARQ
ncbi:MAG TPA: hypothetical protein VGO34_01025 [Alphaproteobacteria bacterium]